MKYQPAEPRRHERPHLPEICRDILTAPMVLDRLLRPDFPAPGDMPDEPFADAEETCADAEETCADAEVELESIEAVVASAGADFDWREPVTTSPRAERGRWGDVSRIRRIPLSEYRPKEVVPDEILTRRNADRGRPHPIPDRPAPEPDTEGEGRAPGRVWELRDRLRECAMCGGLFIPNRFNHRFCSRWCAWKSRIHVCVCPACGVEFIAERPEQVWCSVACGASSRRTTEYDHICARCGNPYRATRTTQRFCSRACARASRKGNHRAR